MPFLEEKVQVDFGPSRWDGVLGLSPADESAGPLFIPYLFEQGKIRANMFSFLPAKKEEDQAKLTYGGYQEEGLPAEQQFFYNEGANRIVAHQVSGSFHWEVPLKRVVIGEGFSTFRPQVLSALTDTGTTIFVMYYKDLEYFQQEVCRYVEKKLSGMASGPSCTPFAYGYQRITGCSKEVFDALPIFHLQLGSYMYMLQAQQYMDLVHGWHDGSVCTFAIYGQKEKRWVLGSPFLNDYYQVYDMTRNQIGLVPSTYTNPSPSAINLPNADNVDELQTKVFVLSVGSVCYIFSQVVRSMLTTNKEPERPAIPKSKKDGPASNDPAEEKLMGDKDA